MRKCTAVVCGFLLFPLLLTACFQDTSPADISPGVSPDVTPSASAGTEPAPSPAATPEPTPDLTPTPTLEPTPDPTQEPTPAFPLYSFGSYLEESDPVEDDSYFDNAVFLGDSRTEGFQLWGGVRTGDYFWKRGMTVFRVDDEKYTFDVDGGAVTLIGALGKKEYGKVYIMIGVNELGYPVSSYENSLRTFIDKVIAAQPTAVIYLQTMPPLNDELARQHLSAYENNENVNAFNEAIIRVAAEKRVVLLNTAEAYRDENGQLPANMTSDGCHFNMSGYPIWADYLRSHTIDPERYFYCRELEPGIIEEGTTP